MPVTNKILNKRREKDCFAITLERKFYATHGSFIKRTLRPSEWQVTHKGTIHVPRIGNERLLNEAAALQFVKENTDIPVPNLYTCFEDDEAVILVTEYIEGVGMNELDKAQREAVTRELDRHLTTLRSLRSRRLGGPSGLVIPPWRAMDKTFREEWTLKLSEQEEYVFCHNDLSQNNVIVDPETLKIAAIIDWEHAGFYPVWFEKRIFERLGPSVALPGEEDDSGRLLEFLESQRV